MRYLADSNLLSELRKINNDRKVAEWIANLPVENLFTSVLKLEEIRFGIMKQQDAVKASELTLWLELHVRPQFVGRVLEIDENVLLRWRNLTREVRAKRLPNAPVDILLAALAQEHKLAVATRNTDPFVGTGVPTFNPWTGERLNGA